jgi:curli production assembly/transport component CsgF
MHVIHPRGHVVRRSLAAAFAALCVAIATPAPAPATELVYVPTNPVFGGSPLNANGFLSAAQMTNKHKEPAAPAGRQNALQQFTDLLERSVLSQLSAAATSGVMGAGGKLRPGTVETGNFRIDIVDSGGGILTITTTDKTTGDSTSFQVGGP